MNYSSGMLLKASSRIPLILLRIQSRVGPTCCRLIRLDQLNMIRQKSLRLFPFVDSRFYVDFRVKIHLEEGVPGTRCMA